MDELKGLFHSYSNLMKQHIKGVEIGCYSVALLGLTVAIRRVRPFSRFKKPTDIPNRFIRERRELLGTVERIDPNGGILMIDHKPLMVIPGIKRGQLPVKVSGVNVSSLGINWLQAIVAGNEVKFVPVLKNKDFLQCEVVLPQLTVDKKPRQINIGESLVAIGFGTPINVEKQLVTDNKYLAYYKRLKEAEKQALKKKLGIKYYITPTKLIVTSMAQGINRGVYKLYKSLATPPKETQSRKIVPT